MAFNAAAVTALFQALASDAIALKLFQRVQGHEPKSAPGNGLSYALWLGPVVPVPTLSGLSGTAGRVTVLGRIYVPFLAKPEDGIDLQLLTAITTLIATYSASFTLGGLIMAVDLLGAYGQPLTAATVGYLEQDNRNYRVAELEIPCLIDDLWTQEATS